MLITVLLTEGCAMLSENKAEELYQAIIAEDASRVRELSKDPAVLNRPRTKNPILMLSDTDNRYPLEAACSTSAELAEILLDAGAEVNVIDPYIKSTPLINTLRARYPERFRIARRLIDEGADVNVVDKNYRAALNVCVTPSPEDTDAARADQKELLEYLLEHSDLKKIESQSRTNPLIEAAKFDNGPALKLIAGTGSFSLDGMPNGYTALMAAAGMGNTAACQILLNLGADPGVRSPKGETAADYAAQSGYPELAEMLKAEH